VFMLVHAGKYRTTDKLQIQTIQKLNTTQEKANYTKHSTVNKCKMIIHL